MQTALPPPKNLEELQQRARQLAGKTLAELSAGYPLQIPDNFMRQKGYVGQLVEWHLGASSYNLSEPDFPHLEIELKTIPLKADGSPQESTYVCTVALNPETSKEALNWEDSRVRKKLAQVLWVPLEADPKIPIPARRLGNPLLWRLDPQSENILKSDWEELMTIIQLGKIAELSAKIGTYLQIRPKAAHSRILSETIDEQAETLLTNPKGFYLRTCFTKKILQQFYQSC